MPRPPNSSKVGVSKVSGIEDFRVSRVERIQDEQSPRQVYTLYTSQGPN